MNRFSRRNFLKSSGAAAILSASMSGSLLGRQDILKPPKLKAGDTVGVISPAGITYEPVRLEIMNDILAALDFKMKAGSHVLDRWGFLAGTDDARASEINAMFADPKVKAIFTLQGGWGSARLLPLLDYDLIRRHPKIVLGFSDITSLLIGIYAKTGLCTFHGPTANSTWNDFTVDYLKRLLCQGENVYFENPQDKGDHLVAVKNRVCTITPGKATGRLVGGNLTVLSAIIGSDYLPNWENHILFLEDIHEDIYRIDRMLTQLKLAGVLDKLTGFIFGKCSDCEPGGDYSSFTLLEVLNNHIKPLGIPAWYNSMIGHVKNKFTLPVGVRVQIDAEQGTILMLESAVI
ncbi:LD-carboxypeptidase [candidate division KSB1 bacterium]|nr:LD-carboxypeptidase [candidate division KSB1 bacterium]